MVTQKKRKQAAATLRPGSHEGAVLSLCWNREYRNVLASGSADTTVKVWDVSKQACEHTLTHHAGKVQCVAWNPAEAPVLLTGGFDRQAALADVRSPSGKPLSWATKADVEALAWVPHDPTCFLVSTEDGLVTCFDARKGDAALYRLAAHDQAACALSFCPGAPGLLATASTDKQVKLWDVLSHKPSLIAAQDLKVGSVFAAGFCASAPYLLAAAGSKGEVSVWNVAASSAVAARYPALAEMAGAAAGAARGEEGEGSDSES